MKKQLSVKFEIGFADSYIQSYCVENDNLILILKCWNSVIIKIDFIDFVVFSAMNYVEIANLVEVFESSLLERALDELYEKKPKQHPYRIFQFITPDDMTALEIVCEDIKIQKT